MKIRVGYEMTYDCPQPIPMMLTLMARGRDAVDVAISNTFGPNTLANFTVWTDEHADA